MLCLQGVCFKMHGLIMYAPGVHCKMFVYVACTGSVIRCVCSRCAHRECVIRCVCLCHAHRECIIRCVFTPCPQGVCYKTCVFTLCPQGVDEAYDQQVYSFFIPYHMLLDTLQRLAININSFDEPLINLGQCLPPPPSSRLLPWLVPVFFLH